MLKIAFLFVSVLFYAAAFPPLEWTPLAWAAPVIWLSVISGWSPRQRFWAMFAVGYLGSAIVVYWLTALFSTMALFLWLVPACYFGMWGVATGWFPTKPWQRVFWPAVAWIGIEYFRCELAPLAFSFGGLGYSQSNQLGFSLASLVGVYGVSALMVLTGASAAEAWRSRKVFTLFHACAIALLVLCSAGAAIRPSVSNAGRPVMGNVILQQLSGDFDIGSHESLPAREDEIDLIVWPELTFGSDPRWNQSAWFLKSMQGEAAQAKRGVLFGAMDYFTDDKSVEAPYYNTAFYVSQNGEVVATAGKNQPVQLMRDGLPAPDVVVVDMKSSQPLATDPIKAGIGICYDGCFQSYSRRMVHRDADFLVFPTMNLDSWGAVQHRQHQRMFQMRAAETGRSVLTAAVSGPTFAAAPGGAVAAGPLPFGKTESLTARILPPSQTAFNMGGWLLGPLTLVLFVGATGFKLWVVLVVRLRRDSAQHKI